MIKSYVKALDHGRKFRITCPELGITVTDRLPTHALCREIMKQFPERGQEKLGMYRGEMLCLTIHCIESWAKKTTSEKSGRSLQVADFRDGE